VCEFVGVTDWVDVWVSEFVTVIVKVKLGVAVDVDV
jgi:hypothetical protein